MLEATATIRDALVERVEPVYGLTTLHASLKSFMAEAPPTDMQEEKQQSYAYGLMGRSRYGAGDVGGWYIMPDVGS